MTSIDNTPKSANSRLKIIAAVGLALILGALMINSDERPTAEAEPAAAPRKALTVRKTPHDPVKALASVPTKPIQRIPYAAVVQYSPFEIEGRIGALPKAKETNTTSAQNAPKTSTKRKPEKPHPALAKLAGVEADIILESSRGRSVRIGPHIVYEGSTVVEGASVQTIDGLGALVELESLRRPVRASRPVSSSD